MSVLRLDQPSRFLPRGSALHNRSAGIDIDNTIKTRLHYDKDPSAFYFSKTNTNLQVDGRNHPNSKTEF